MPADLLTPLAAGSSGSSSSGGGAGFLVIAVIAIVGLGLLSRNRNKVRAQQQSRMESAAQVGSEVMTTSGIFGTVTGSNDEQVLVEIAPGVEVRFARAAIARVITPDVPPGDDEHERLDPGDHFGHDHDHDGHDHVEDDQPHETPGESGDSDPPEPPPGSNGDTKP